MLYAGLDLSRHRLDVQLMNEAGEPVWITATPPDVDRLRGLVRQTARFDHAGRMTSTLQHQTTAA